MEQIERQTSSINEEKSRRRTNQLEAMQRISQELSSTLDMNHLLDVVMREAVAVLNAKYGFILLQDRVTHAHLVKACAGLTSDEAGQIQERLSAGVDSMKFIAKTLESGQTQVAHDDSRGLSDLQSSEIEQSHRSAAASPIFYAGEVVGLISLFSERPNQFAGEEIEFLEALAAHASIAIGNEWRYEEQVRQRDALHRRAEQFSHLFRLTQDARTDWPMEDVLENAAYGIQESVGFNIAMFSVVEGEPPIVRRVAAAGLPLKTFEKLKSVQQPLDALEGLLREEYQIGSHAYFFPQERMNDWGVGIEIYTSMRVEGPVKEWEWHPDDMLLVPLLGREQQLLGVLSVDNPRDRKRPDPATVATLEIFASQAAIAIENRRLFELERRRAEAAEAMLQVGQALSSSLEPQRILQTVADEVVWLFQGEQSSVILFDQEQQLGILAAQHQSSGGEEPISFRVPLTDNPLIDLLVESKAPVTIYDVQTDPLTSELKEVLMLRKAKSLLVIPLLVRDKVTGIIALEATQAHRRFTPEEIAQCQLIANQAATAIENARLYDEVWAFSRQLELRVEERTRELRHERDRVEAMYRISSELSTSLDLEQIMNQALELLQGAVGSTEGLIMLIDPRTEYLVIRAAIGRPTPVPRGGIVTQLQRGVGLAGWVLDKREAIIVSNTASDERWVELPGMTYPSRAALAVPLTAGEDVLGVLFLYHEQLGYFSESHLALVTAAASKVASAIGNAELYRLITDQAERLGGMLRRQQEETSRNKAILESIADGVLVNDVHGKVILMNAAAERILGARAVSAIGQDVRNFFAAATPEGREQAIYAVNELLSDWTNPRIIQSQLEMGGKIISTSLAPVLTGRRELLGLVTILRDITREVEADRTKSEFVSTVSHELRTPMTSVKGYTDLLAMEAVGALNDAQRNFLNIIQENAARLTTLIDDLLDISRIETGRIKLSMTPIRIDELVHSVVASMDAQIQQRGQKLLVDVPADLPAIMGDKDRLTQVLVNLVGNATLYTDEGGTIAIRAHEVESAVAVEISDSGIGIDPEDVSMIFDRFYRGESSRVQACQGTGLGLAIVKSFVEMHGGRIWVESQPGAGSTFTFTLPRAAEGENS